MNIQFSMFLNVFSLWKVIPADISVLSLTYIDKTTKNRIYCPVLQLTKSLTSVNAE